MSVNTSLADETEFFSKTFEPITLGDGTWYASCTGAKILAYTNPDPGPAPFQTKADATRELNNFLINQWPNARVRSALYQIKQVIDTPDWGPDTMVKMLPDLDVAFFDGRLRSRVHASWQDWHSIQSLNPPVPDFANLLGITWFRCQTNTCSICLNRQKICLDPGGPRLLMLQTLVHEMVVSTNSTLPRPTQKCAYGGLACLGFPQLPPATSRQH